MKNWALPLLAGIGVIFFVLSFFVSKNTDQQVGLGRVASLDEVRGSVSGTKKTSPKKFKLTKGSELLPLDTLETNANGEALIRFDSGFTVRVFDNAFITIDKENESILLIVKRGDIHVESFGNDGQLVISKEGQRFQAAEYNLKYKGLADGLQLSQPSGTENQVNTLSTQQIQDTLNSHRNDFYRCYTKLLQKSPGVTGQSTLAFLIDPSGRVLNPSLSTSSLADNDFKVCLLEVISRVQFKSFVGESISAVFPLRFE